MFKAGNFYLKLFLFVLLNMSEQKKTRNVATAAMLLLIVYIISAVFYHHVEGWEYIDCVYFVTVTITTIGYGDIVPHTAEGKVYSIFLAFTGISLAFYIISSLAFIREKTVDPHLHRRLTLLKDLAKLRRSKSREEEIKKKLV